MSIDNMFRFCGVLFFTSYQVQDLHDDFHFQTLEPWIIQNRDIGWKLQILFIKRNIANDETVAMVMMMVQLDFNYWIRYVIVVFKKQKQAYFDE